MNDVNIITDKPKNNKNRTLKAAQRSDLLNASLKAIFVNKKVHIFSSLVSIKGTCVDIVQGEFCLTDATYEVFSSVSDFSTKGESAYMMVPKFGKNTAILEN